MQSTTQNNQGNKGRAVANIMSSHAAGANTGLQFTDNRPEALAQRKINVLANNAKQMQRLMQLSNIANNISALQTNIPSSVLIQAKLPTVEKNSSEKDVLSFIDLIKHEMERQEKEADPKSPAIGRIKNANKDLLKAETQMKTAGIDVTIDRLNRIINSLNKNITQELIPDYDYGKEESKEPELDLSTTPKTEEHDRQKLLIEAMTDPMFKVAKNFGILDDPQIIYWLQPDYLEKRGEAGIPATNCIGLIVELMAKDKAEEKYEKDFIEGDVEVFQGVKIVDPSQETSTGKPRIMREIDILVVKVLEDEKMVPLEIIEAKAQKGKKPKGLATDLAAKVKDLATAYKKGWQVITRDGEDITDDLVPEIAEVYTAGPSDEYDVRLNGELAEELYEFINKYRYGFSAFWH